MLNYDDQLQSINEQIICCEALIAKLQKKAYEIKIQQLEEVVKSYEGRINNDTINKFEEAIKDPDSAKIMTELIENEVVTVEPDETNISLANEVSILPDKTYKNENPQNDENEDFDDMNVPEDEVQENDAQNDQEQEIVEEKPKKERKPRKPMVLKEKTCKGCGKLFAPRSGRQEICDECKANKNK